ncbi:MAG TPA: hypothetical protein VML55_14810 [Planctomycetaceae bacterium]|nr:hypothetical protein [Planctomycetaceae bacterium]
MRRVEVIIERMAERLDRELPRAEAADLWTATYVLVGLRYDRPFARALLRGVREIMKESTTYQEIVEEGIETGRVEAKQDVLILIGSKRFGHAPDDRSLAAIRATKDLERLEELLLRALDAEAWSDLFADK